MLHDKTPLRQEMWVFFETSWMLGRPVTRVARAGPSRHSTFREIKISLASTLSQLFRVFIEPESAISGRFTRLSKGQNWKFWKIFIRKTTDKHVRISRLFRKYYFIQYCCLESAFWVVYQNTRSKLLREICHEKFFYFWNDFNRS